MKSSPTAVHRLNLTSLLLLTLTLFSGVTFDFARGLIWNDQQRVEQIILLLIMSLTALSLWHGALLISFSQLPSKVRHALGFAFLMGVASALLSAYPRFAGLEWATLLLQITFILILSAHARFGGAVFDQWALRLTAALALVITFNIMHGYVTDMVGGFQLDTVALFADTFSNRRVFGHVASLAIPLLAYPLLAPNTLRIQRWGMFALLSVLWMLVLVSGTRGTLIALAVAAAILAVLAWHACARWLKLQALALLTGALLYAVLFIWVPSWTGDAASVENRFSDLTTLSGRDVLWSLAWTQIQAHPWLGIGPMHLATLHNPYGAHPHNAALQLAAEWGIPAALALLGVAVYGLMRLLARLRQTPANLLLMCLTASLLAISAQAMVDGIIVIPYTQTWLMFVMGWTLGVYFRRFDLPANMVYPRMMQLGLPLLIMLALGLMLYGIFPEVLNRAAVTKAYVSAGGHLLPRYWSLGWIP